MAQRRHRAIGHRDRAVHAAFDLRQHEGAGGARDMRARARLRPGAGMQSGADRKREQRVPGRIKFDLVDAITVTVIPAQYRRVVVGGEAKPDGFRGAERRAERVELVTGPAGILADERRTKHPVSLQQIVRFERRRLVGDVVHRGVSSAEGPQY